MAGRHRDERPLRWRSLRAAMAAFVGMGYAGRHRATVDARPLPERAAVAAPVATAR
jgi:hypothetical protein